MTQTINISVSKLIATGALLCASSFAHQALADSNRVCSIATNSNCFLTGSFPAEIFGGGSLNDNPDPVIRFVDGVWYSGETELGTFGSEHWTPVVGDWDGDGIDNIGVYRNGLWIFKMSWDFSPTSYDVQIRQYGDPTWTPHVGDWNNDGIDSLGLYKDGVFKVLNDSDDPSSELIISFDDVDPISASPIAAAFDRLETRVGLVEGDLGKYVNINQSAIYSFYNSDPNLTEGLIPVYRNEMVPVILRGRLIFTLPPVSKDPCPTGPGAEQCNWISRDEDRPNDRGRTVIPQPPAF